MTDIVDRYIAFFRGRGDVYGNWEGRQVKAALTRQVFENHLGSGPHIGVYPSVGDLCSWGCVDVDGKDFDRIETVEPCDNCGEDCRDYWRGGCQIDGALYGPHVTEDWDWDNMFILARNLQTVLAAASVSAHIERTKNGFHIWVFPEEPLIKAATMRRALMAACKAIGYNPKEVNPKQEEVGEGCRVKYGNYVRLPYYGALYGNSHLPADRYFVEPNGNGIHLDVWLDVAEPLRAPTATLEALATLWTPPQHVITLNTDAGMEATNLIPLLDGLAYTIWKDGPLEGDDRSGTLAKLAYKVRDCHFTADACLVVLRSANARWGKWHDDPEHGELQLQRMVENAYAN